MKSIVNLLPILATAEAVNVVSMGIGKNPASTGKFLNPRGLGKRDSVSGSLVNNVTAGSYLATVKVGTPPQELQLALDTGSSDVWVLSQDASVCETIPGVEQGECTFGTFDANSSSTFDDILPGGFSITYQDNTGAKGDYFTDDFTFGNATVQKLQMGLGAGRHTTINLGIMGIGYDTNEATQAVSGGTEYPNLIDQLVSQGLINIKAYSLWLDELNSSTGSILFGGIDTEKYMGDLISVPLQVDPLSGEDEISSFTVALTGLTTANGTKTTSTAASDLAIPVLLDSGTTLTYLPDDLADQIYNNTGAINDLDNSAMVLIDCNAESTDMKVSYQFGSHDTGPIVTVPISELIFSIPDDEWDSLGETPPFDDTCMFGIFPESEGPYLLGDTFLRSAYVVYDLANNEIALAQTDFDSKGSKVVEIQSGASSIPLVSGVASGVSVEQTATGLPGVGGFSSGEITATATGSGSSVSFSSSSSSSIHTSISPVITSPLVSPHASSSSFNSVSGLPSASTSASSSSTAKSASSTVPAFDFGGLLVLGLSGVLSLVGGVWFVI